MIRDTVCMEPCDCGRAIPPMVGQVVMVRDEDDFEVPMKVLRVYPSGAFDGEVVWGEG